MRKPTKKNQAMPHHSVKILSRSLKEKWHRNVRACARSGKLEEKQYLRDGQIGWWTKQMLARQNRDRQIQTAGTDTTNRKTERLLNA